VDRVNLDGIRPLQIRSGHTPVNLGLLLGSLAGAIPAIITIEARSQAVGSTLPLWASYVFYGMLAIGAATALSATWYQLPHELNSKTYRVIISRLIRERVGHYAVGGIMLCFAASTLTVNGFAGLPGADWLVGCGFGLLFRAWQTHVDVRKLHDAIDGKLDQDSASVVADPDQDT
jgi:hypothetical protein